MRAIAQTMLMWLIMLGGMACSRSVPPDSAAVPNASIDVDRPADQAKLNEAKAYIGAFNRGQQAFYLEKSAFSASLEALGLSLQAETPTYSYRTQPQSSGRSVANLAIAKQPGLPSYLGLVYAVPDRLGGMTTLSQVCLTDQKIEAMPVLSAPPANDQVTIVCPAGFKSVE